MAEKTKLNLGAGWILVIYFALKPIYLFSSGSMQLCDYFMVLALLFLVCEKHMRLPIPRGSGTFLRFFAIIILYQCLINGIWYLVMQDRRFVMSILFSVFNCGAFYLALWVYCLVGLERTVFSVTLGSAIAVIVATLGAVVSQGLGVRNAGLFNNPNQLGYFSLVILSVVARFPESYSRRQRILLLAACMWLVIVSASKAAFIGMMGLSLVFVFSTGKKQSVWSLLRNVFFLTLVMALIYLFFFSDSPLITGNRNIMFLRNRIVRMASESDSDLGAGRGYGRIKEMGIHFLWGMGEGGNGRFVSLRGFETHSTYANLIVSYGWLGFAANAWAFCYMIGGSKTLFRQNLVSLSGVLLYFFSHNGIRNTLFWIVLGVMFAIRLEEQKAQPHRFSSAVPRLYYDR